MLAFPSPSRAPLPLLPFEFYPTNYNMPEEYPDDDEKTKIRAAHLRRGWHTDVVVCTARGTTLNAGMHFSRCILAVWHPRVSEHVVKCHILAHSCPEDLLNGIHALLARLKVNHLVHPTNQCNVWDPSDDTWYVLHHALPQFSIPKTLAERKEERRTQYDRFAFGTPLNSGKLTLLKILVEKSHWWHQDRAVEAALQHAAAAN
jgi:hypothetical protein